ncbi:hypothetical protein J4E86_007024 [Alternaria arbusti]|uniref:uncharacterized protein n=1 Tax=Alternaria arbusti TaxID=232088 RepID=UPI0022206C56|nr:uncharacterized protein J4E86_007024 [Alternaria arbusti]KAI4951608.1 hypothetical protein J4E86_007024 [Alternaria arbusti]
MGRLVTFSTSSLNNWALEGNANRIREAVKLAKADGARYVTTPELSIPGYGCLDHFLEQDTVTHSWQMLASLLVDRELDGICYDVGMPVRHSGSLFNARIVVLDGKILLIRPKMSLAMAGNYREGRYFIPWSPPQRVEQYELHELPAAARSLQDSAFVPIGDAIVSAVDCSIGYETCEELFTPRAPHIDLSLAGVDIIINSSGSHHELRKLDLRLDLIRNATSKAGGAYLVLVNGTVRAQAPQFSLNDIEVITATIDLEEIWSYRTNPSRGLQAASAPRYERFRADIRLASDVHFDPSIFPTPVQTIHYHRPEEEIALGPACWLWDYLRRSGQAGFMLPLSGGIDSCATATLVFSMCRLVYKAVQDGNKQVLEDVRRIVGPYHGEDWVPTSPKQICNGILHTVYMGMSQQSSKETRRRAKRLAEDIGCHHVEADIDDMYAATKNGLTKATGFTPRFKAHGGSPAENLALQNIQARARLVQAYYFAQMLPLTRGRPNGGSLLVLASGNVDECLRGYLTKYDCSSADLNPIGSVSKVDLKRFIAYAESEFELSILGEFLDATPTAELEPITEDYVQSDEVDMGMTYAELGVFGKCRKELKLGPYGTWVRLAHEWSDKYTPTEVAVKVKQFFHYYAINRHKMTTMTPSYHAEAYSPDDNRFDLRPFLYPPFYQNWSFKCIDEEVAKWEKKKLEKEKLEKA